MGEEGGVDGVDGELAGGEPVGGFYRGLGEGGGEEEEEGGDEGEMAENFESHWDV